MLVSLLPRALALIAFVVLGIVWSSERTQGLAAAWVASFALVGVLAVWADVAPQRRPTLSGLWESLPSPSKHPDDYR